MASSWPIRRHLFALVLAIVVPTVGLLLFSLQSNVRSSLREASTNTETVAQIAAADTQRFISDSEQILAGLAKRPKVRALDPANCDDILKDFKAFLPQFANIAIADRAGRVVCSALSQPGGKLASVADAAWLAQVRQANRFVTGHPHIGPVSHKWVSVLAYPMVSQALADSGLEARWLELEITESMLMRQPEEAEQILRQITASGVRISLDDFGTGYSSLAYLKRFPVGTLKIDQSFVRDLHNDPDDAAIVTAVISLARSLDMDIVAEGVELAEQLRFLAALDCDYYQGYLYSKPISAEELTALLRGQLPITA